MNEKLLKDFLVFLSSEGLLIKPLSHEEIINRFYSNTKATATVKAPKGYEGFTTGEKKESAASKRI